MVKDGLCLSAVGDNFALEDLPACIDFLNYFLSCVYAVYDLHNNSNSNNNNNNHSVAR